MSDYFHDALEEDEMARSHMRQNPSHELTIGEDDCWHCVTCEAEERDILDEVDSENA